MFKPVHIDDTNFLSMARQAAIDPWRPHDFVINWQGSAQPAFEVLSNPPGIAWWLAAVSDAPVWIQHLWMLPWLWLAIWGAGQLGKMVAGHSAGAAILIVGSPVAILATHALTPDLPLLACVLAGMAGILRSGPDAHTRRWPWALLLGTAALFRYSGAALIPVVALWPWLHGERRAAAMLGLVAATPLTLLALHDIHAYGQIHLLAMTGFQSVANTGVDVLHKAAASLAMLGGAVVLPILCWRKPAKAVLGAMLGAGLGCTAVAVLGITGTGALAGVLFAACGGSVIAGALARRDPTDVLLVSWLVIGVAFLLFLRFSAARYWLPFMAPVVLLSLRTASDRLVGLAGVVTMLLGLGLATDDLELAHAHEDASKMAIDSSPDLPAQFAGHWGFQFHMEQAGWMPVEDDATIADGAILAAMKNAWPQSIRGCREAISITDIPDSWPGPRIHTLHGGANVHGHSIAGEPPIPTLAPWSLGSDPLDQLVIYRGCAD